MADGCDKTRIAEAVDAAGWFAYLPEDVRESLAGRSRLREVDAGQFLTTRGEMGDSLFGLIKGRLRGSISSPKGQEVTIADFEPGDWLGNYPMVGDQGAPLDVLAVEPSTVVSVPLALVRAVGDQNPALYRGMFEDSIERSRRMFGLIELVGAHGLPARLAIRLLMMLKLHGKPNADGGNSLGVRITQTELAHMCYGTRQNVNRIIASWVGEGIVEVAPDGIVIRDIDGLIDKASGTGLVELE